jgi:hypothetical protein
VVFKSGEVSGYSLGEKQPVFYTCVRSLGAVIISHQSVIFLIGRGGEMSKAA